MTTTFKIQIGDWSGDGHGEHDDFIIKSNKSVEDVRKAYFKSKKDLPKEICPENFLNEYNDCSLPKKTYELILSKGFDFLEGFKDEDGGVTDPTHKEMWESGEIYDYPDIDSKLLCDYVLWYIKQSDSELKLERTEDVETLAFYGFKNKKHIGFIGYGLFYQ